MSLIQVVVAEESALSQVGLQTILEGSKEIEVAHTTATSTALLELLGGLKNLPHLCLLSSGIRPVNSYETLVALRQRYPAMPVIILSHYAPKVAVARMLLDGAAAFLLKDNAEIELLDAIFSVYEEGFYNNAIITPPFLRMLCDRETVKTCISHEELQFLSQCCLGENYNDIASGLYISNSKAHRLRHSLFKKLEVSCRTGLVKAAIQLGIASCADYPEK